MIHTIAWKILLIVLLLLSYSCDDGDSVSVPVSGQIIDAFTKAPIENVKISILEEGPIAYSDKNGKFTFSTQDLSSSDFEKVTVDGLEGIAVSLSNEAYRPKEFNLFYDENRIFELVEKSTPAYVYNRPVQLNDGLEVSSLSDLNIEIQLISNLMEKLFQDEYPEVHSVLVYKDNQLVIEEYFFGNNDTIQFENGIIVDQNPEPIQWSRTEKHYVASVNKALTSALVGIALDQHNLSVNEKISQYLPDYSNYFEDPNKAQIDIEDCLTMTAGVQWDEWGANDLALLWQSDDFADFVLDRSNLGPGFEWRYNSALPNLLLKCIDNLQGGNVRQWSHENFYSRLGIEDYDWQNQPDGFPEGAARMFIRSRDMIKIGATFLNKGRWNGEQVVPEAWVNECFEIKESTSAGNYSYYFWLRSLGEVDYLSADGDGGNYINIFPEQNMVIVITQGNYLKWPFYVSQANDIMENYILPAVMD